MKKYLSYLKKYSSIENLSNFFDKNNNQIKKINAFIYNDYFYYDNVFYFGPGIYFYRTKDYFKKSELIRDKINYLNSEVKLDLVDNNLQFKFHQSPYIKRYPLIKFISYNCYEDDNQVTFVNDYFFLEKNVFFKLDNEYCSLYNIRYSNLNNKINDRQVYNKKLVDPLFNVLNPKSEFLNYFNLNKNKLYLKKNTLLIDENIFIPPGYEIILKDNQKIFLVNHSSIISKSPIITENNVKNIFIGGKKDNPGGGIYIFETKKNSKLNNIKFAYLDGFTQKQTNFNLQGALNFYKSDAILNKIEFQNIKSEDAINSYRAKVEINNSKFDDILSDAIDIDFGEGKLSNLFFKNIQNDAIDVSGSSIDIYNITATNCGDKIISVGEKSKINIENLNGYNSFIGIANKDESITTAKNIKLVNVKIGFASYIKKNEYLTPYLDVSNYKFKSDGTLYLSDKDSKLIMNSKRKKSNNTHILDIIYNRELNFLWLI